MYKLKVCKQNNIKNKIYIVKIIHNIKFCISYVIVPLNSEFLCSTLMNKTFKDAIKLQKHSYYFLTFYITIERNSLLGLCTFFNFMLYVLQLNELSTFAFIVHSFSA